MVALFGLGLSPAAWARCVPDESALSGWTVEGERSLPTQRRQRLSPGLAAGLGIIPGLGHVHACDWSGAALVPIAAVGSLGAAVGFAADPWPQDDPLVTPALIGVQNIWFYGIYDGFRVASLMRGERSDRQPVDRASVGSHLLAPYKARHLRDPWVLGSVGVGLAAGSIVTVLTIEQSQPIWQRRTVPWAGESVPVGVGLPLGLGWSGLTFTSVGFGEEALFRGVVQPALVDALGPPGGIVVSSVIFGAAHIRSLERPGEELLNAAVISSLGGIMGYVAHRDRYALGRPIAMHFWYDTALYTAVFLLAPDSMPWSFSLSTSW